MPGENENELREFGARLRESLKPVGDTEELLAERIESCAWRLKRIKRVEAGLFAHGFFEKQAQHREQQIERQTSLTDVLAQARNVLIMNSSTSRRRRSITK
jgi:hypothetical protein